MFICTILTNEHVIYTPYNLHNKTHYYNYCREKQTINKECTAYYRYHTW